MIPFAFGKIIGLLLFFTGLMILRRCPALERIERKAGMKRKVHETMLMVRPNWQAREASRHSIPRPFFYSILGTSMALLGMVVFSIY